IARRVVETSARDAVLILVAVLGSGALDADAPALLTMVSGAVAVGILAASRLTLIVDAALSARALVIGEALDAAAFQWLADRQRPLALVAGAASGRRAAVAAAAASSASAATITRGATGAA